MKMQRWEFLGIIFLILISVGLANDLNVGPGETYITIQSAIEASVPGDTVIVAEGTYTGDGNRDIDFGGRSITVRSIDPNDPNIVAATIIDCQGDPCEPHRGFKFHSGEDTNSILSGLTITNGFGSEEEFDWGSYSVGGAIYCHSSSPTIINCLLTGNSAIYGGGMFNWEESSPIVTNCTFSGNSVGFGGGMCNFDSSSSTVINCTFSGNSVEGNGGGMYNNSSSPTLTNCTFIGNSAVWGGGGMENSVSSPIVTNCIFSGNSVVFDGGGMNNYASDPIVTNCTFTGNSAGFDGGGVSGDGDYGDNSSATIVNCIFWGNIAPDGPEIYDEVTSSTTLNYSDIQGGWGGAGGNNISTNPFLADIPDQLRLLSMSPCIDAGDPCYVGDPCETDLDGLERIVDGDCDGGAVVDMGAYEFDWVYVGDFEGDDCDVDLGDFAVLADSFGEDDPLIDIAPYLDPDGVIDLKELFIVVEHFLEGVGP